MMKRNLISIFVILTILTGLLLSSCSQQQKRILDRLLKTETAEYEGETVDKRRVEELEEHVKSYSDEVERLVRDTGKLGVYYKMLALEYMDREMFGEAYAYFLKSLEIYPNNHIVHYYTGLSRAQLAGAQGAIDERLLMLEEAAYHHRRAVDLKSDYFDALYALSVLYIFELEKPLTAEQYVLRALEKKPGDERTLFLLARIRIIQGRFEEAVELYDNIIAGSENEEFRSRARTNRDQLLGGGYNE